MNKFIENPFFLSNLVSKDDNDKITSWDVTNMYNIEVCGVAISLYQKVIEWLCEGKSYDEICSLIDNFDSIEYEDLMVDQKAYVKSKVKNDLNKRKSKLKGEMK